MRQTIQTLQDIDHGETSMGWALETLQEQHERDLRQSAENPARVSAMLEQDIRRFEERQPEYRQEIENQLKGNPKNIEQTAPDILY